MTAGAMSAHGQRRRGSSPFASAAPGVSAALVYALALVGWLVAGDALPGGRWLAVHLFTLGVLTNAVLVFSAHFGRTLTRTAGDAPRWPIAVANAGILAMLVGLPTGVRWLLVVGAVVLVGVVFDAYRRLRRLRREAVGARFSWVVRAYERAHGQFVHGAVLGALMGAGVLGGGWYLGLRYAHLHAMVLGWGGITLLATIVFFGPTMARTRIVPGADDAAARAVRVGATALTLAVVALLALGLPAPWDVVARAVAAVGLAVVAWAAWRVCGPLLTAMRRAKPTAPRWHVAAVAVWLPLAVAADAVVVAGGWWPRLDAVGVLALAGALGQAVLSTLLYLAPMLRHGRSDGREVLRRRLEHGAVAGAVAWQAGVVALALAALGVGVPAWIGWMLLVLAAARIGAMTAWPAGPRAA